MLRVAICPPPPQKKLNCKSLSYNMIKYIWWLTIYNIWMKCVERSWRSCVHKLFLQCSMYEKNQQSPITGVKFVESKWQYNMIKYIWWLTILQNLNEIRWAVSDELRARSCDGRTHGRTDTGISISPFRNSFRRGTKMHFKQTLFFSA